MQMNPWSEHLSRESAGLASTMTLIQDSQRMLDRACFALALGECDASVVQAVNANVWGLSLSFYKEGEHVPTPEQARAIIVALTKEFGDGVKSKDEYGDKSSLRITWGEYPAAQLSLTQYRPAECRLVTKTRVIPAKPATEEHVETYTEIECDKGSEYDNAPADVEEVFA